jgi:MauM/NapG family ferredoxin protein
MKGIRFGKFGDSDRRQFFQDAVGEWVDQAVAHAEKRVVAKRYLRPPGALPEVAFLAACTRCGDCIDVCPPHAIVKVMADGGLAAGTPFIDPARQPCTVCPDMPCAAACPTEALTPPADLWNDYQIGVLEFLPDRCITFRGMNCNVCALACPVGERALVMDETGHPVLRAEGCVGCGTCLNACVSTPKSFTLTPLEHQ